MDTETRTGVEIGKKMRQDRGLHKDVCCGDLRRGRSQYKGGKQYKGGGSRGGGRHCLPRLAGGLALLLLCLELMARPLYALAALPQVEVDETLYLNLDYYGAVSEANVVKGLSFYSLDSYTDYGEYTSVTNMSTAERPEIVDGSVTFRRPEGGGKFFFEGGLDPAGVSLPWHMDVTYKLNGVVTEAADLAGASGLIEIDIDAWPDKGVSAYMQDNFMLFAALPLDMEKVYSLDAPDSQTASIGQYTGVIFEALPGKEGHFTVRIGTESFETIGLLFLMSPATVGDLAEVKDLKELKDKFRDNTNAMMDDVEALMDDLVNVSGQLALTDQMLLDLQTGKNILHGSRDAIHGEANVAIQDLRDLSGTLSPLDTSLRTAQWLVYDVNKNLNVLDQDLLETNSGMRTLSTRLRELSTSLGSVDNVTAREINSELSSIEKKLEDMGDRLAAYAGRKIASASDLAVSQIRNRAVSFAEEGLNNRETVVLNEYIADMGSLDLSGAGEQEIAALARLLYLADHGFSYSEIKSILAGTFQPSGDDAERMEALQEMSAGTADLTEYEALAGSVLSRLVALQELEKASAQIRNQETESEEAEKASDVINGILDALDGTESELAGVFDLGIADRLSRKIASVSTQIKNISTDLGSVSYQTSRFLTSAQSLAADMDDLTGLMNEYYEDIQDAITNTDNILLQLQKSSDDLAIVLQTVNDNLLAASEPLGRAADEGIAAGHLAIENMGNVVEDTRQLKNSGADLRRSFNDELDEQEEENNFLNMDPYAKKISFTSAKNQEPSSLSIICRTEEISLDKKDNPAIDAEIAEAALTPLDRIINVLKILLEMIRGFLGIQ